MGDRYAGIGKRVLAFFVDMFIIDFLILFPLQSITEKIVPKSIDFTSLSVFISQNSSGTIFKIALASSIITVCYFTLLEFVTGQTPGKMLFGIYTIAEKGRLEFANVLLSNLVFLSVIPFIWLLWIAEIIYLWKEPKHQRFTEKIAGIVQVEQWNKKFN